jgi:hypothetical protein
MSPIAALARITGGRFATFGKTIGGGGTVEPAMTAGEGIRGVGRINGGTRSPEEAELPCTVCCTIAGGCWGSTTRRMMRNTPDGNPPANTVSLPRVPRSIVMSGYFGKLIVGVGWCPSSSSHSMDVTGMGGRSASLHAAMVIGTVYGGPGNLQINAVMIDRWSSRSRAWCHCGGWPMVELLRACQFRAQISLRALCLRRPSSLPVNADGSPKVLNASHPKWRVISLPTGVHTLGNGILSQSTIVVRMRPTSGYESMCVNAQC